MKSAGAKKHPPEKVRTKLLNPVSDDYTEVLTGIWKRLLPEVDASAVPLFSAATVLGRQAELFHENLLKPLGFQLSEYHLLATLFTGDQNGMTPAQLNTVLKQTSAGITKTVARLEKRKLIQRQSNPEDNRSILIRLSKEGHEEITMLCSTIAHEQNKKLAWLSPQQKKSALAGLKLLLESMN